MRIVKQLLLTALFVAVVPLLGTTRITTQLRDATATTVDCRAEITPSVPFISTSGTIVNKTVRAYCAANGMLTVDLEPTDVSNPANVYYKVDFYVGTATFTDRWQVPTTGVVLSRVDVRITTPPGPSFKIPLTQLDYTASVNLDCIMRYNGIPQWRPCVQGSGGGGGLDGRSTWLEIESGTNTSGSISGTTTWAVIEQ
jgi:hypothetical protein